MNFLATQLIGCTSALLLLHETAAAQDSACETGTATQILSGNEVAARLSNTGIFFYDRKEGPMYRVPENASGNSVFSASLWIGGFVHDELRVAGTTFGPPEFWPGPLRGVSENCAVYDRLYSVTRRDIFEYEQSGVAAPDLAAWPWHLGAPMLDGDGIRTNYDLAAGDRPALVGSQTVWWTMNDAGGPHQSTFDPPLNVEVQVTAFAVRGLLYQQLHVSIPFFNDVLDRATFYRFKLLYRGEAPVENMYVGFLADPDIGDASDDYAGSDSVLGMGYVYNGGDYSFESGFIESPAVGFDFINGFRADTDGIDNDADGSADESGERMKMTSFIVPDNGYMGWSGGGTQFYRYLQARWPDGTPLTIARWGRGGRVQTRFMYPGEPGEFWSNQHQDQLGDAIHPADQRFVMGMGPISMHPGEEQDFTLGILWALGENSRDSVRRLKIASRLVQLAHDLGRLEPGPEWVDVSALVPHRRQPAHQRSGLGRNHPNPFSGWTTIPFQMLEQGHVRIAVYDVLGREVAVLIDGAQPVGQHEVTFDAAGLAPGVYFCRMSAFGGTVMSRMVVTE